MKTRWPNVAIIILNWEGAQDTIECLESVFQITYPNYGVIVVDNGSRDDSIEQIKRYAAGEIIPRSKFVKPVSTFKPVKVIELEEDKALREGIKVKAPLSNRKMILIKNRDNYGFPKGNNIGIKFALRCMKPKYLLLLNNDTVVAKDFLEEMVKVGEKYGRIGILGPTLYHYASPSEIWAPPIFAGKTPPKKPLKVPYTQLWGTALLIKSVVFQKVGLLDESYFLYGEESDFCLRTSKFFDLYYCPSSRVWHKTTTPADWGPHRYYYECRNLFYLEKKYFGVLRAFRFLGSYLLTEVLPYLKYFKFQHVRMLIRGIIDGIEGKRGKIEKPEKPHKTLR